MLPIGCDRHPQFEKHHDNLVLTLRRIGRNCFRHKLICEPEAAIHSNGDWFDRGVWRHGVQNLPSPHDEHLIDGEQLRYWFVKYKL